MKGAQAKAVNHKQQVAALGNMLRQAVKGSFPGLEIDETQMDYLAQLCAMSTVPTGDEDPRKIMRSLSDSVVDAVVAISRTSITNPILARLSNIFRIEWCFRHGHLEEDWKWEWKSALEGQLHYRASKPLDQIAELAL
jgi:hypothetical protein